MLARILLLVPPYYIKLVSLKSEISEEKIIEIDGE